MINAAKKQNSFDVPAEVDKQWCPGCGNFPILQTVKKALVAADKTPQDTVFVSGIGQAAKLPQYMQAHYYNGLHGRALPAATGIKAANPRLSVIVTSGDGDIYGEGACHLVHTLRRNPDITVIVHDNMIYGLTKGQAAPTTQKGMVTPTQPQGVYDEPINPLALAISLDAPFVARANAGDPVHAQKIIEEAMAHKGFSLVDIFQPCVVFNKKNTYQWFKESTYELDPEDPAHHDVSNREQAFRVASETDKFPLGVIYKHDRRPVFEQMVGTYDDDRRPLFQRERKDDIINALLATRK